MHPIFLPCGEIASTIPVTFVNAANWRAVRDSLDSRARSFADSSAFEPKPGRHLLLPSADGALGTVLFGIEHDEDPNKDLFRPGALCGVLPSGSYRFASAPHDSRLAALAFALGCYRFTRYHQQENKQLKTRPSRQRGRRGRQQDRRGRLSCTRPHQHSGQRHGPGGA